MHLNSQEIFKKVCVFYYKVFHVNFAQAFHNLQVYYKRFNQSRAVTFIYSSFVDPLKSIK